MYMFSFMIISVVIYISIGVQQTSVLINGLKQCGVFLLSALISFNYLTKYIAIS